MRGRFPIVVLACALCLCPALAVEDTDIDAWVADAVVGPVDVDAADDGRQIVVNVDMTPSISLSALPASDDTDGGETVQVFMPYSTLSLDAGDDTEDAPADTVRAALEGLFGPYTPRRQTVTQYLGDGTSVTYDEYVPGLAGMDWTWLSSVAIFALMLYCLFRLLGGVVVRG